MGSDGLFNGISGMFNVFDGVIGGVEAQSSNLGQLVAIGLILGIVGGVIVSLFTVFRNTHK